MSVRFGITLALLLAATVFASPPAPAPTGPELFDVTVETGSCDWYCGAARYRSASVCDAACADPCERLCW